MNLTTCYRLLGLQTGASAADIKASYRRLARQYHPDMNPDKPQAQEKFIEITEAYRVLMQSVSPIRAGTIPKSYSQTPPPPPPSVRVRVQQPPPPRPNTAQNSPNPPTPAAPSHQPLSDTDHQLRQTAYRQLQLLFQEQRFPRAIALVEGLAQRFPNDPEIRQWQAWTYQRWGRHLVGNRQFDKARIYLKKALRIDPHNTTLWAEVERDFRKMEISL